MSPWPPRTHARRFSACCVVSNLIRSDRTVNSGRSPHFSISFSVGSDQVWTHLHVCPLFLFSYCHALTSFVFININIEIHCCPKKFAAHYRLSALRIWVFFLLGFYLWFCVKWAMIWMLKNYLGYFLWLIFCSLPKSFS